MLPVSLNTRISWLFYFRERAARMQTLFLSLLERDSPILVVYSVFSMMFIIRHSHKKIWVERKMSILFGLKFASVIAPSEAFFRFLCQFLILIYYWHFSRDV